MYDHIKTTSFGLIIASYKIIIPLNIFFLFFWGGGLLEVQQSVAISRWDVFFYLGLQNEDYDF